VNLRQTFARSLRDPELRRKMAVSLGQALGHRAERVAQLPEWEALRDAARDLRAYGLAHLEEMLTQFEQQLTSRGAKVYWAGDAATANRLIVDLLRERGVGRFVKGKSMTTEETRLNDALIAAGMDPVETDLGEYLVQLAGDRPAHPTAPALHLSRQDCGRLICQHLDAPYTDDPTTLTLMVRDDLRPEFLKSPVGITSANFAVAETGTLVIVDNEGNQGLVSALPDVHIALVGIDKLVPRLRDLGPLLRLLARSCIGQALTCYTTLISGPRQASDADGPRELHVILLDNGRTRMLADPFGRQGMTCIRCGVCCNICPIYCKVGGHPYGWTYPGAIGSVWAPFMCGEEWAEELPHLCSLCGACAEICPVRNELPHHLAALRSRPTGRRRFPWSERLGMGVLSRVLSSPRLYRLATRALRWVYPLRALGGLAPPVRGWLWGRELPPMPRRSFQETHRGRERR
jgi:L-lactate dehydrogenase complex protein LldF